MIASIGYDCHSGLAHLVRDFWKNGVIDKVLMIRHPSYSRRPEHDLPPPEVTYGQGDWNSRGFLDQVKAIILFETAVGNTWGIVKSAKARGVRIIIVPMYEYSPFPPPVEPDLIIAPSPLDYDYYKDRFRTIYLTVPSSTPTLWKLREKATTFVHNAGHGQHDWAKGTLTLVDAMKYVQSPITLHIRLQTGTKRTHRFYMDYRNHPRLNITFADLPEQELYTGDVFINAEEFNGLSLPLQEAYSSGMLVMTSNRYPANFWLPNEPLIPVKEYRPYRIPDGSSITFNRAVIAPTAIAQTIDRWYGKDIRSFSERGKVWAEENSWDKLRSIWKQAILGEYGV